MAFIPAKYRMPFLSRYKLGAGRGKQKKKKAVFRSYLAPQSPPFPSKTQNCDEISHCQCIISSMHLVGLEIKKKNDGREDGRSGFFIF